MGRRKNENHAWSSLEAAQAECQRVLGAERSSQLITEFREAEQFVRSSKWLRGEARAIVELYKQIETLGPTLRAVARWLSLRKDWALENVPRATLRWIFEGLNLQDTAKNTLRGTRFSPRELVITAVVVDHLIKTGRAPNSELNDRILALLAIASGVDTCPGRSFNADRRFDKARKRWGDMLRRAITGVPREDFDLAEFLEVRSRKIDGAST